MKKFMKVYKTIVIVLMLVYIILLSALITLLGEWGVTAMVNGRFDEAMLGLMGFGAGIYVTLKLTGLFEWIIETKI